VTHQKAHFRCLRLEGPRDAVEAALAAVWESGASGVEERGSDSAEGSRSELIVYAPAASAARLESSLREWARSRAPTLSVGPLENVAELDWAERYRAGQQSIEVSPRLRVRPPWVRGLQRDVVIEARQAFGTGAHASTALALAALDQHLVERRAARVLDLGCGSGVLSIAALRCGAARAFACDIDPQAVRETAENARLNRVAGRLEVWCGSLAACRLRGVDLAIANLIRHELLPQLPDLAGTLASGGWLWLSGLLDRDVSEIRDALRQLGLRPRSRADRHEGGDHWVALGATRH
jgi:ribosomal protein L11 methyltransferase